MLQQHAHCAFEQNKTRTKEHCAHFSITTTTTAIDTIAPDHGNVGADELTNKHSMRATTYPVTATTKPTTTDGWRSTVTKLTIVKLQVGTATLKQPQLKTANNGGSTRVLMELGPSVPDMATLLKGNDPYSGLAHINDADVRPPPPPPSPPVCLPTCLFLSLSLPPISLSPSSPPPILLRLPPPNLTQSLPSPPPPPQFFYLISLYLCHSLHAISPSLSPLSLFKWG